MSDKMSKDTFHEVKLDFYDTDERTKLNSFQLSLDFRSRNLAIIYVELVCVVGIQLLEPTS